MQKKEAGFEIYTKDRVLQVNQDFKNVELLKSFTLRDFFNTNGEIEKLSKNKHLLFKSTEPKLFNEPHLYIEYETNDMNYSGLLTKGYYISDWDKCVETQDFIECTRDSADKYNLLDTKIYLWGFDKSGKKNTYGLQVFNNDGEIVFDSNKKYMKIVGFTYGSLKNYKNLKMDIPKNKKTSLVVLGASKFIWRLSHCSHNYYQDDFSGIVWSWFPSFFKTKNSQVVCGYYAFGAGNARDNFPPFNRMPFPPPTNIGALLIDVTDY